MKWLFLHGHILGALSFALYLLHVPLNDLYLILVNHGYLTVITTDWG